MESIILRVQTPLQPDFMLKLGTTNSLCIMYCVCMVTLTYELDLHDELFVVPNFIVVVVVVYSVLSNIRTGPTDANAFSVVTG